MRDSSEPVVYVVAVSGGVDSVVLLDMLATGGLHAAPFDRPYRLAVAHFDHGIRPDSAEDRRFVEKLAAKYPLPYVFEAGHLGADVSEATARHARYDFLRRVKQDYGAVAIVTAHHQDDVLETAVLNLLRGTGRKGLSSLRSTQEIIRPLLGYTKAELLAYARDKGLEWREDSTNRDTKYLRNYVRHVLLAKATSVQLERLRELIGEAHTRNILIDSILEQVLDQLTVQPGRLDSARLKLIPEAVAKELLASWLRRWGIAGFDRRTLHRLWRAAMELAPGKRVDINKRWWMEIGRNEVRLVGRSVK